MHQNPFRLSAGAATQTPLGSLQHSSRPSELGDTHPHIGDTLSPFPSRVSNLAPRRLGSQAPYTNFSYTIFMMDSSDAVLVGRRERQLTDEKLYSNNLTQFLCGPLTGLAIQNITRKQMRRGQQIR